MYIRAPEWYTRLMVHYYCCICYHLLSSCYGNRFFFLGGGGVHLEWELLGFVSFLGFPPNIWPWDQTAADWMAGEWSNFEWVSNIHCCDRGRVMMWIDLVVLPGWRRQKAWRKDGKPSVCDCFHVCWLATFHPCTRNQFLRTTPPRSLSMSFESQKSFNTPWKCMS